MRERSRWGRWLGLLFLAGVLALVGAACGGDGEEAEAGDDGESSTTVSDGSEDPGAAGDEWDEVVAAAEEEGEVLLYTVLFENDVTALEEAFEEEYPEIDLQFFRGNTGEVITRLNTELDSGQETADMVAVNLDADPSTLGSLEEEGGIAAPAGPTFEDREVQAAKTGDRFFVYATVFSWGWNTEALPEGIDEWGDLLDSDLGGGRIGLFDPTESSIIPACYQKQVETVGPDFLEELAAQDPRIMVGGSQIMSSVVSGEISASAFTTNFLLQQKEEGAPVDYAVAPEGACVAAVEAGILSEAQHPNAAQVFANWMMTEEAQALFTNTGHPAREEVPGALVNFSELEPDVPVSSEEHQEFIDRFNRLFR